MPWRGICRLSVYKSQESLLCESIGNSLVKVALNHQQIIFTQTVLKVKVTLVVLRGTFPHIFTAQPSCTFLTNSLIEQY